MSQPRARILAILLRILVAACLLIDAVVHLHLASRYQLAQPNGIGEGTLFRVEGALALIAGVYVLLRASRPAYALAAVVALGGVAAVLLYRYVNVPAVGPIPAMYEPIWFFSKTLSAVAEVIGGLVAAVAFVGLPRGASARSSRP